MNIEYKVPGDFKPTLDWLARIKRGLDDARPLWVAMIPRIKQFVRDEFSGANPSRWKALTIRYRHRKSKEGFPHWIGVRTGAMRQAAGESAKIELTPRSMKWRLDETMTPTKSGIPYSYVFHWGRRDGKQVPRPIYTSTIARVNQFLKTDIKNMEGQSRMSFTFQWLENAIKPK